MKIHDLSLLITHGMPAFPGEPTAGFIPFASIERDDCEMWQISLFTQLATHLDAPSHFISGGRSVERIDLARCVGPATVVHLEGAEELGIDQLAPCFQHLRHTGRLLVATGWDARFGESGYFTDYPSMTREAADALAELGVQFLGLDTPSPHRHEFRALHEALFSTEIVIAESLTGVRGLTEPEVLLIALPLRLQGLDGSPVRAIAIEGADLAPRSGR